MKPWLSKLMSEEKKQFILKLLPEQKQQMYIAIGICLVAGFAAFIWDQRAMSDSNSELKPQAVEDAATYIPDGFVLVPIDVANAESLDSILGQFGVVDLFIGGQDDSHAHPRKLASHVKILRAPLNPSHFAVLVPDSESQKIVAANGALTVVVQNPMKSGATLVNSDSTTAFPKPRSRHSRVVVEVPSV